MHPQFEWGGKPNHLKVFGNKKIRGPKQESEIKY
jgi:hypothetical protein